MRPYIFVLLAFLGVAGAAVGASNGPVVTLPGQEHWVKQSGGFSMAVLYGNPAKGGFYVMRLKTGAGWIFPAHYHPGRENVTVISGTFYAGMGKKYDARKLTAFPPGSFISIPGGQPHYAMTKGPAVIQLSGDQPFSNVMVK